MISTVLYSVNALQARIFFCLQARIFFCPHQLAGGAKRVGGGECNVKKERKKERVEEGGMEKRPFEYLRIYRSLAIL
jgi:hypothetical protein